MTFNILKPELPRSKTSGGIRAELRKGRNQQRASLMLSFSGLVRDEIGLHDDEDLAVMLGENEDHGVLRIRKAVPSDPVKIPARKIPIKASGGEYHRVKLGHVPIFVNESRSPQPCMWERLDDGWFEIVLPAWADETAPKRGIVTAINPKLAKAKAAAAADANAQDAERKEAEERRYRREMFGDEMAEKMERAGGKSTAR